MISLKTSKSIGGITEIERWYRKGGWLRNTVLLQSYHFIDEQTVAQPFPRSHRKSVTEWALNPLLPMHWMHCPALFQDCWYSF